MHIWEFKLKSNICRVLYQGERNGTMHKEPSMLSYMFSREVRRGWTRGQIRAIRCSFFVSYYAYLTSAMTHIQVRGDLMCTLFNWSPHQTQIFISSIVTRIVWISVGLLRIGTCKLVFSGGKIQLLMTVRSSTIGLMGHMEGNGPLDLLELWRVDWA